MNHGFLTAAVHEWTTWMAAMFWQVALLAAAVLLICTLARKASPRFRYFLWCLVFLKLCLPPSMELFTGIGRWLPSEQVTASTVAVLEAPFELQAADGQMPTPTIVSAPLPAPRAVPPSLSTSQILFISWLTGIAMMVGLLRLQYGRVRRRLRGARAVNDAEVLRLFHGAREALGIQADVLLFKAPELDTPILFGLRRPAVYLPIAVVRDFPRSQLKAVLIHELAHYQRRDLLVNWLQVVLQTLYWFHPVVWLAGLRLRQERELVVDDIVLAQLGGEQMEYGESLLNVMRRTARKHGLAAGYVGIIETKRSLTYRLNRIMDVRRKVTTRLGWTSAMVILALALLLIPQAGAEIVAATDNTAMTPADAAASPPAGEARQPASPEVVKLLRDANAGWLGAGPKSLSYTFTMKHTEKDDTYTADVKFTAPGNIVVAVKGGKTETISSDQIGELSSNQFLWKVLPILRGVQLYGALTIAYHTPERLKIFEIGDAVIDGREATLLEIELASTEPPAEQMRQWEEQLQRRAMRSLYEYEFLPVEKTVDGQKQVVIQARVLREEGPSWREIQESLQENPSEARFGRALIKADMGEFLRGEIVPLIYIYQNADKTEKRVITSTIFHEGLNNSTKKLVAGEGERVRDDEELERLKQEEAKPRQWLPCSVGCGISGTSYGLSGNRLDSDRVWIDKATGLVIREEGWREGELQSVVEYEDYEKLLSGREVPLHVRVTLPETKEDENDLWVKKNMGNLKPWVFDMRFSTYGGKTWLLDQLMESSEMPGVTATARVTNVVVE
jgi:beta-lactamase regulating signal transducer with metallopeptidase domain